MAIPVIELAAGRPRVRAGAAARTSLAALAVLALSACITTDPGHDPAARMLSVEHAEVSHLVAFAPGQARMPRSSVSRLDVFLKAERVGRGDRVIVLSRPVLADAKQDRLAADREAAVASHLALRGIDVGKTSAGPAGTFAPADSVTILVRRPMVVTPHCTDWPGLQTTDELIGDESQFGCITTTALGTMVGNPGDLEEGRDGGPFDGDAMVKSVQRYREGKAKTPEATNTQKGK